MDESAFRAVADATLERIGLALDAMLETSNARFEWTLADGVLAIDGDGARVVVRRDLASHAICVDAGGSSVAFRPRDGRWQDDRDHDLGDALVRALKSEARIAIRMPDLPAG